MTVSEQIIQVLDTLCEKFGLAIDWTSENVVPYLTTLCTKLITYEIWSSVATIIEGIVLGIVCVILVKKLYPVFKNGIENDRLNYDYGWRIGSVFAIVGLVVFGVVFICVLENNVTNIIKCVTFPELVIVERVQQLINSAG